MPGHGEGLCPARPESGTHVRRSGPARGFGRQRAIAAVRETEQVHARVRGVLDAGVGPFARGTPYDASEPRLLFWVYATLVDTALVAYERFVGPLTAGERAAYYEESKMGARLFGIPEPLIPPTLVRFEEYMDGMIHGEVLAVGATARDI